MEKGQNEFVYVVVDGWADRGVMYVFRDFESAKEGVKSMVADHQDYYGVGKGTGPLQDWLDEIDALQDPADTGDWRVAYADVAWIELHELR